MTDTETKLTLWHTPRDKDKAIEYLVKELNVFLEIAGSTDRYLLPGEKCSPDCICQYPKPK